MLPHDKLDWNIRRLEAQVQGGAPPEPRLALARACLSRGRFHDGGAAWYNKALAQARRVLHRDPEHAEATVLAGLALVLLDRAEPAARHLEDALTRGARDPLLHLALGEQALRDGDEDTALRAYDTMCQLAPESWEAHLLLGRLLAARALRTPTPFGAGEPAPLPGAAAPAGGPPRRAVEHAQYHLVRALMLQPAHAVEAGLVEDLALLCLRTDRVADAERLLHRLLDFPSHKARAHYHLGRVAARTGRHKRAIWSFRHYLDASPDHPADVWTRIAASNLHLGQAQRARDACGRALALEPSDIQARQVLGSALLALGLAEEAVRTFREILEIAPENADAFAAIVRMRARGADLGWLRAALRTEVGVYDRLPVHAIRREARTGRILDVDPRAATRARIQELIRSLGRVDTDVPRTVLSCLDLTTDEGLRFVLWEGVLELLARRRAEQVRGDLSRPGDTYRAAAGRDILTLAPLLAEEDLVQGLAVEEEDLRRAAVARHGPADDVVAYRATIAAERAEARAWQALLLLAIAAHRTPSARNLLVRWAADADDDLAFAARAGLAMCGDREAAQALEQAATAHDLGHLAGLVVSSARPVDGPRPAVLVSDRDDLTCSTCGRRGSQVAHVMTGPAHGGEAGVCICSVCLATIHDRRDELRTRDPDIACAITGATLLDTEALYVYQGVPVSEAVVLDSLGHDERETVASFLAAL